MLQLPHVATVLTLPYVYKMINLIAAWLNKDITMNLTNKLRFVVFFLIFQTQNHDRLKQELEAGKLSSDE